VLQKFALDDEHLSSEVKILESMKVRRCGSDETMQFYWSRFQGLAAGTPFLRNKPSIYAMRGRLDECHAEGWK
jgi:hypothetical protein